MLTVRENFMETIKGGNPDRFVKQYEFMQMVGGDPSGVEFPRPMEGGPMLPTKWGVMYSWPQGVLASFPVHTPEYVVIKDITKWRDYVNVPKIDYPDEAWAPFEAAVDAVDTDEYFCTLMVAPGIFEMTHHLQGMDNALVNYYAEPEATKDLIDMLTDYEIKWGEQLIKHSKGKAEAVFHHDDWGTHISTFMSNDMFDEFILPAYKKIYGFYKDNGIKVIVHHSDSYAATLVPQMIEMGVDVFQGCVTTNDVPKLVKQYGEKISFMGDLNNGVLDIENCPDELIMSEVERACRNNGKHYFIPCLTMGGPSSIYPGVYEKVSDAIDVMSKKMF